MIISNVLLFVPTRQIEGKVVEISRLQEIFAEKVLQQVRRPLSDSSVSVTLNSAF